MHLTPTLILSHASDADPHFIPCRPQSAKPSRPPSAKHGSIPGNVVDDDHGHLGEAPESGSPWSIVSRPSEAGSVMGSPFLPDPPSLTEADPTRSSIVNGSDTIRSSEVGLLSGRRSLMASSPGTSVTGRKSMLGFREAGSSSAVPDVASPQRSARASLTGGGGIPSQIAKIRANPTYREGSGGGGASSSTKPRMAQIVQASIASRLLAMSNDRGKDKAQEEDSSSAWDEAGGPSSTSPPGPFNNRPWELNGISYLKHYAGWAERDPKKRSSLNHREKSLIDVASDLDLGSAPPAAAIKERSSQQMFERVPLKATGSPPLRSEATAAERDRATAPVHSMGGGALRSIQSSGPERNPEEVDHDVRSSPSYHISAAAAAGGSSSRRGGALDSIGSSSKMQRVEERLKQGSRGGPSKPRKTLKELQEEIEGASDSFGTMDEAQLKRYLEQNKTLKPAKPPLGPSSSSSPPLSTESKVEWMKLSKDNKVRPAPSASKEFDEEAEFSQFVESGGQDGRRFTSD